MRRRDFLSRLCAASVSCSTVWPLAARAQQKQRLAVLVPSHGQWQPGVVRDTLAALGHQPGVTLQIDVVSAEGRLERLPALAEEIARTAPDVIIAVNTPTTHAVARATGTI